VRSAPPLVAIACTNAAVVETRYWEHSCIEVQPGCTTAEAATAEPVMYVIDHAPGRQPLGAAVANLERLPKSDVY